MAKVHFYYSAMNAGKSTTLLQSSYNYNERGMETLLFLPSFDDRGGEGYIASRIGLKAKATCFDSDFDFAKHVSMVLKKQPRLACLLVDEAQFLTKEQVKQLCCIADFLNIPVLAYGLRSDFLGETFEGSQYLLAWADVLVEIKTICRSGRKATMNMRINTEGAPVLEGEQVSIGGNERYTAVSRKEFAKVHGWSSCLKEAEDFISSPVS
jgi:thymidine kinase